MCFKNRKRNQKCLKGHEKTRVAPIVPPTNKERNVNMTNYCIEEFSVFEISLTEIDPFPCHPYVIRDDEDMEMLVRSIQKNGVIAPAIVRKKDDGRYELISGHRRKRACERIGIRTLPCVVKDVDDDTAIMMMVESNYCRSNLLPSEKAKAYRMHYESIKHQGQKQKNIAWKNVRSDEVLARKTGASRTQIQRFLKLSDLIPELLDLVDKGQLSIRPAVALADLNPEEQTYVLTCFDVYGVLPTEKQVKEIKHAYPPVSLRDVEKMLTKDKQKKGRVCFDLEEISQYFPKGTSKDEMKDRIMHALDGMGDYDYGY